MISTSEAYSEKIKMEIPNGFEVEILGRHKRKTRFWAEKPKSLDDYVFVGLCYERGECIRQTIRYTRKMGRYTHFGDIGQSDKLFSRSIDMNILRENRARKIADKLEGEFYNVPVGVCMYALALNHKDITDFVILPDKLEIQETRLEPDKKEAEDMKDWAEIKYVRLASCSMFAFGYKPKP